MCKKRNTSSTTKLAWNWRVVEIMQKMQVYINREVHPFIKIWWTFTTQWLWSFTKLHTVSKKMKEQHCNLYPVHLETYHKSCKCRSKIIATKIWLISLHFWLFFKRNVPVGQLTFRGWMFFFPQGLKWASPQQLIRSSSSNLAVKLVKKKSFWGDGSWEKWSGGQQRSVLAPTRPSLCITEEKKRKKTT